MNQNLPQHAQASDLIPMPQEVIELASDLLKSSRSFETSDERTRSAMMARMMADPSGKQFTMAMADQVLRIPNPKRAAARLSSLIHQFGIPSYLPLLDRIAIRAGNWAAFVMPKVVMPLVTDRIRKNSDHVIVSADPKELKQYLASRKEAQIRVNYNQIGEAVLGEKEANRRLQESISRLQQPEINYVSVKLSAIASQISLVGYQQTLDQLRDRLRTIYLTAIAHPAADGSPKFVNLDMEEYRDLQLTVTVFQSVLDEPEFEALEAGMVIQAYLPDSFEVLQSLTKWAIERHARTGGRIKLRLVKGANLAMEKVEASIHGWPQTPYGSKIESDANFKRLLEYATRPEHVAAVRVGVASHNLFDIALALLLRERRGVETQVEFEMLEGMANGQALEVQKRSGGMLMYSPVVADEEFEAAVAYLVRRLDENTDDGSFLGAMFSLQPGSSEWDRQAEAFTKAMELAQSDQLLSQPRRTQNRLTESPVIQGVDQPFENEPDTDFALPANRQWASEIHERWKDKSIDDIPLCIAGDLQTREATGQGSDPSRPGHAAYRFAQASSDDVESALTSAAAAQPDWESHDKSPSRSLDNAER
ncbi:bifunctional proline dehydrogenase/L-glutamate gamma-semialdehyde dehydrogenase [Mariniblastus sp.]|nr:bifunctional proline dehydrogenase/L-glutamate gamma-semialdehyde dehydrogenase [Mariniblastus sp.]